MEISGVRETERWGYHIKNLPPLSNGERRCVHTHRMLTNWRVTEIIGDCEGFSLPRKAWCYSNTSRASQMIAVAEALLWDGGEEYPGMHWIKEVHTGRFRAHGQTWPAGAHPRPPVDSEAHPR